MKWRSRSVYALGLPDGAAEKNEKLCQFQMDFITRSACGVRVYMCMVIIFLCVCILCWLAIH